MSSAWQCSRVSEVPLQATVPVPEQCADAPRDDGRQRAQRSAEFEREAIAHNGFGVTMEFDGALVAPASHAEHRRLLVESTTRIQLGYHQMVVVEWQHTEQSHTPAPGRGTNWG